VIKENSIHVSNRTHLNHTNELIYKILSNLDSYHEWWPGATFTKTSEGSYEVAPMGPGSFTWKIAELVENRKVVLEYEGMFNGKGTWLIEKDAAMTFVTYSVSANIEHKLFQFINKFMPINKLHSKMMPKVFRELNTYLNNYHEEKK
jgi:carbon monoxide dehydrogenase subunit G